MECDLGKKAVSEVSPALWGHPSGKTSIIGNLSNDVKPREASSSRKIAGVDNPTPVDRVIQRATCLVPNQTTRHFT